VWKNNKEVKGKVRSPIIYFAFAFATDKEPEDLHARVSHEWHRHGGILLKIKELQTFKSKTILCIFNIFTSTRKKTVLYEFQEILEKAMKEAQKHDSTDFLFDFNDLPANSSLPAIELCLQNPKLPGQDTSHFNKISWKSQVNRKAYHVECDSCYLAEIKRLTQLAKESNIVKEMWGKHAHVSKVVDKDSTSSKIKCLIRVSQVHCNYQCSMLLEDLVGITDLNASTDLYQNGVPTPLRFSLRQVLLRFVKLGDGHQLFVEVHQSNEVMGRVQALIPNTPEVKQMVLMMNKNLPAYIGNALRDQGLPKDFLMDLLKQSCCSTLFTEMGTCLWDPETGVLTTQRETNENQHLEELKKAVWFKDAFEDLRLDKKGRPKQPAPPPKALFNLDEDRSIKTIHLRNEQHLPSMGMASPPLEYWQRDRQSDNL
jgi:hypothetical protein